MDVADIKLGIKVRGKFLAAQVERRTARTGKNFLWTILKDKSGEGIVGRQFDTPEALFASIVPGLTVDVEGEADEFQGSTNVRITKIAPSAEQWDASELLPRSQKSASEMKLALDGYVARIENQHVRSAVEHVLASPEVADRLGRSPAAKSRHHAVVGGLLEHILELLAIAATVADVYPQIRRDYLYAGCILHDIGKVVELALGPDIEYTSEGIMIGHVVIGDELLTRACREVGCPPGMTLELRNMILGHHGTLEWGSPVLPKTLEALAVHQVDMLSSRVRQAIDVIQKISRRSPGDPVSQWDRASGQNWYLGVPGEDGSPAP